jgi:hypothetical protein
VLSDSEDEDAPRTIKMPKITDSDHEGEENDDIVEERPAGGENGEIVDDGEKDATREVAALVESDDDGEPIREG